MPGRGRFLSLHGLIDKDHNTITPFLLEPNPPLNNKPSSSKAASSSSVSTATPRYSHRHYRSSHSFTPPPVYLSFHPTPPTTETTQPARGEACPCARDSARACVCLYLRSRPESARMNTAA